MKGFVHQVSMVLGCVAICAAIAGAQDTAAMSGVPGDGIPDVYYNGGGADAPVLTSQGEIMLGSGVLTVDTDGADAVAMFVGGPDVSVAGCALCDGMNMPGTDAVAGASTWTLGYSAGSNQYIRTNPLTGDGFIGVAGVGFVDGNGADQAWPEDVPPFLDFSDAGAGLLNFGTGLGDGDFSQVFSDGTGEADWSVQIATNAAGSFFTNVTVVPEPAAGLLSLIGLSLLGIRRRS